MADKMTIDNIKSKCSSEITDLVLKAFRMGEIQGVEEGKQAVDGYEDGIREGADLLKKALLDRKFNTFVCGITEIEDYFEFNDSYEIVKEYKTFLKNKPVPKGWEHRTTFSSPSTSYLEAICPKCGYVMQWDKRSNYCPYCGNHNMEDQED